MDQRIKPETPATAEDAGGAPNRRKLSLRGRLLWLVMCVLLPAVGAAAFLIWTSSQDSYRFQERQLAATARTLSLVVDRQLSEQTGLLNALAASNSLEHGDWAGFDNKARRALANAPSWVAVRTMDGQQLVNTLRPRGAALAKVGNPRVAPNRPPRPDGVRVSNIEMGALAQQPVIVVVKAVTLADGSQVDVSIVTRADSFSDLLRRQRLPSSWIGTILDGSHRVVARSRDEARFKGAMATPVITSHLKPGAAGLIWGRSLDGVLTRTAYEPVDGSDWTVLVAVPRAELAGPARRALLVGALVALVLLVTGMVVALGAARRITRAVRGAQDAVAAGVGQAFVSPPPSGVAEIDELAAAFEKAAVKAAEHDAQQQLLINELNHRVKNTLATLQSVAMHTRRNAQSVEDYHRSLEGRILAMSGAHELLTRGSWSSADLEALARTALSPFESPRLTIEGPPAVVEPTEALNLSMVLYELATNAAKYGALAGSEGEVSLQWRRQGGATRIEWTETGGAPVEPGARRGFGSRLIENARATYQPSDYRRGPEGVRCVLTVWDRARP